METAPAAPAAAPAPPPPQPQREEPPAPAPAAETNDEIPEWLREIHGEKKTEQPSNEPQKPNENREDYSKRLEEYENLLKNPLVAKAVEYAKAGKEDATEFLQAITGPDHASMSNEELQLAYLKSQPDLTQEDIEEAMEDFKQLKPYQQKQAVAPIRSELDKQKAEKLKSLSFNRTSDESVQQRAKAAEEAKSKLPETLSQYKKSGYYGMAVSDEMAVAIEHYINNVEAVPVLKDGKLVSYDLKKSVDRAMKELFFTDLLRHVSEQSQSEKIREYLSKRQRPTASAEATNRPAPPPSREEDVKSGINQLYKGLTAAKLNILKQL